jgi:hypothetical protein
VEVVVGVVPLWGRDLGGLLGGRYVGLMVGPGSEVLIAVHRAKNFACWGSQELLC